MNQIEKNQLTYAELEDLVDLKKSMEAEIEYIIDIFAGKDIETNLGYITWDLGAREYPQRNEVVFNQLQRLKSALDRIKSESADQ